MLLFQVDAFANQIFKGNPAGVCLLSPEQMQNSELMQNIAAEMNLSETAFLSKQANQYHLRWFTPQIEVDFCGHGTLSSAHILWETGAENKHDIIQFNTRAGLLSARYVQGKVELDFPTFPVEETPAQENINLALGIQPIFTAITRKRCFLEVESYSILKGMSPDFGKLKAIGCPGFMVTCKSNDPEYDFYSRYFAPAGGVNEDPVTGSSHSSLAPYWGRKLGKNKLMAYQASKRGGVLECELLPNGRVLVRGNALTVFKIEIKSDFI